MIGVLGSEFWGLEFEVKYLRTTKFTAAPRVASSACVGVWGLGFGVWGLGFGVWGSGFGVRGLGSWLGFGCWVVITFTFIFKELNVLKLK